MTPLPRFVSQVFFLLACFVLPQQAAAQTPPQVDISFEEGLDQEEGSVFRFTVNLSAALLEARTFNIAYSTFDPSSGIYDPATLATDLGSDRPTTLTIPTGVTEMTFDVPTVQDNIAEKPEVFSVALSVSDPLRTNPRNLLVLDARANNTIRDNDTAAIQIFSQRQVEHQDFRFRITTNGARSEKPIPMTWTVTDGTASVVDDLELSSTSGSITLPASRGNAFPQAFLEIPINNDGLWESDETFTVTLSPRGAQPAGVVYNPGMVRATGTITDSNTLFQLSPAAINPVVEGRWHFFTINLNKPLLRSVHLTWTATSGTATVEEDLERTTGQVFFSAGSMGPVSFRVRSVDDTEDEADETYTVTIKPTDTLPFNTFIDPRNASRTVTLRDNDEAPAAVAPAITTQPTDQSVTVGETATFTVAATGTPTPTYQWRFEGSDISGATSASYTLSSAALTDAGEYTVVVTNTVGTVTSTAATLTVTAAAVAPQITTQPTDQSVTVGETATFTVAATGTPTPTYQWRFEGSDISGATSASYTLSSAALTDAGEYTVVVTNTVGTVTSTAATLTVTAAAVAPQITTQPTDQSVTVGETATFTVAATGTPTPTYQWRFEGSDISGATSASYTLSSAALTDAGEYTVVVTNTAGTVTSTAATLTVTAAAVAPQITTQPTDQSVTVGGSATFTVAATGTPTPTYQWRFEGSDISGATSASYTLSSAALTDAGEYTVVVTNTVGTVTSTAATLTVTAAAVAPQITTQPTDQSVTVGETATFTVAATGTPTPTYQWRFEGSDISGATSASYTLSSAALTDAGEYTVVVTNTVGTVTSTAATLTVTAAAVAPQITTQPTDQSVTVGETATFTVAATGTPTPTYQWRFDGTDISGATSETYTLSSAALTNAGDYTVVVTNTVGTVTSTAATLTVTAVVTATVNIDDMTAAEDAGAIDFTVRLSRAVDSDVTLAVAYAAGDTNPVTLTTDLGTRPDTVTIDQGQTSATLTVQIIDDVTVEGEETFTVTVDEDPANRLPADVIILDGDGDATGTITEDDRALVSLSPATHQAIEGGSFSYTVRLSAPVDEAITVGWVAGASADDLEETRGTVRFAANDTVDKTFTIQPVDDEIDEPNETFTVFIGSIVDPPAGVRIDYANYSSAATILDESAGVWVRIADAIVDENVAGGTVAFTVSLSRAVDSDVTLDVSYADGSATLVDDLLAGWPDRVTIDEGDTSATFSLPVKNDGFVEGDETFTVIVRESRANRLPADVIILDGEATGTIRDDDTGLVSLSPTTAQDGTRITFRVNMTKRLPEDLALGWTATLTPESGPAEDDPLSGTVTVRSSTSSAQFTIDAAGLTPGTLTVRLSDAGLPPGMLLDDSRAMTTHLLNHFRSVSIANADPVEEGAGPALFTVSLNRAVADDVWLDVRYSATSVHDLGSPLPGGVFIARGKTSAMLSVPIRDDEDLEGRESFTVTIRESRANPLPAGVTIADGRATLTITDEGTDDGKVLVSLSTETTQEGTVIVFEVNLTNPLEEDLALGWTAVVPPSGREPSDFDPLSGMVTVRAGDIWAPLAIDTAGLPPGELLVVELSAAGLPPDVLLSDDRNQGLVGIPGLGSVSAASVATVSIEDADPVTEDVGTARFMVSLSRAVGDDVVLDVAYGVADAAGSAAMADLGSDRPATVTIAAGATEAPLDVPIVDDGFVEGEETFEVIIANVRAAGATEAPLDVPNARAATEATPDVPIITNARATGTITQTRGHSVLVEPRRTGAGAALRRHVSRFESMTGTVVRNRLKGSGMHNLSVSADATEDRQDVSISSQPFEGSWGTWIDGAWAGIDGNATGRQADIYGGVDYRDTDDDWLIGALIGYEFADLDIGEATFRSDYFQFGLYGGTLLSERLLFDGALAYGVATPEVAQGNVSASYDAHRFTARGALTGDFGLEYGLGTGSLRIEPQLGLLYSSETLGVFIDSADNVAKRETLELGRLTAGPRLTRNFDGGQVTGGVRMQWDFLRLDDGVGGRVSGAADIGGTLELAPGVTFGVRGDIDGIGIGNDFRSFGGSFKLTFLF